MSQVTPRTGRSRKSRKGGAGQEAALLATRRREPMISGVTDGETFHLIVEPLSEAKRSEAAPEARGLFDEEPATASPAGPRLMLRAELAPMELPYRFTLACSYEDPDGE